MPLSSQTEYPYAELVEKNRQRGIHKPEYEIEDTGVFAENRYWDIQAEYCKNSPNDVLIRIRAFNRGPEEARLHLLPTLWYRNTWYWGCTHEGCTMKPKLKKMADNHVVGTHETLGKSHFYVDLGPDALQPPLLCTENEHNSMRLWNLENYTPYTKDAFHRYVVEKEKDSVMPEAKAKKMCTKVAPYFILDVGPGESQEVRMRLTNDADAMPDVAKAFGPGFDTIFEERIMEADSFYNTLLDGFTAEQQKVARQSYAGLLWSKQFYHYVVKDWLMGDPDPMPTPPAERLTGRNSDWKHLFNRDVVSMPDKWEYPWVSSWALHWLHECMHPLHQTLSTATCIHAHIMSSLGRHMLSVAVGCQYAMCTLECY